MLCGPSLAFANGENGKKLFLERCAMCHGTDVKGTGPLAHKSNPPTPDLTTAAFKKRLRDYPGVIVSSVILRPNGDLIPRTLRENGVKLPPHAWTVNDFRDLNDYLTGVISQN
ncbi:MAG: cytochrome c [Pseudomonadota bacterium]